MCDCEELEEKTDDIPVIDLQVSVNDIVPIDVSDPNNIMKKPINGQKLGVQNAQYIKSLHNSQKPNSPLSPAAAVEHPEKYSPKLIKANGNLRIIENPQVCLKYIYYESISIF